MTIPLGIEGQITNSQEVGHTVKVLADPAASGGFLVYEWWQESNGPNENSSFNSWVENEAALEQFFVEAGWVIKW